MQFHHRINLQVICRFSITGNWVHEVTIYKELGEFYWWNLGKRLRALRASIAMICHFQVSLYVYFSYQYLSLVHRVYKEKDAMPINFLNWNINPKSNTYFDYLFFKPKTKWARMGFTQKLVSVFALNLNIVEKNE